MRKSLLRMTWLCCIGPTLVLSQSSVLLREETTAVPLPPSAGKSARKGLEALRRGDFYDAVRFFREAESRERIPVVLKLLAVAYHAAGQHRLFTRKMVEALHLDSTDFELYYYLGRHYQADLGDCGRASSYFRDAIQRNPAHARSHYYLGACFESSRKLDVAAKHFEQAIRLSAESGDGFSPPWQGMARVRLLEQNYQGGLDFAQRAVQLEPASPGARKLLARALQALGKADEAVKEWEAAAQADRSDSTVFYQLYRAHSAAGRMPEAAEALSRYKALLDVYGAN